MKIKKSFALTLIVVMLLCTFIIPTNATETVVDENTVIIIENESVSEETKAKIIAHYIYEDKQNNEIDTYGLTCTLFGHKLESSAVTTIKHKVRSSSPRCLQERYNYQACTRCDYETSTLISSSYIVCC